MIRISLKLLTLTLLIALVATAMPHTTTAQDDTEALRERVLTAWDATADYSSGIYAFDETNSNSSNIVLNDGTTLFSTDSTNYTGTHTFSYDESGALNVQSAIGYGSVSITNNGPETTTVSESVGIELRLVNDVLYLSATPVVIEGSDLEITEGWFILSEAFSEEDLDSFGEELNDIYGGIDFSFFDFDRETESFQTFIDLVSSATALSSSEGTDSAGNPVEVITIDVDPEAYLATVLDEEEMTEEDMQLMTMIFENVVISVTVSLDADGNMVAGDANFSTVYSTTDLASMGFPEGSTGAFELAIETISTFEYSELGAAFSNIEAPADALPME